MEVSVIDASYVDRLQLPMPSLNEFVPRDNGEDKDRQVSNSDGVAVDLGAAEHPYWEEIRHRNGRGIIRVFDRIELKVGK